MRPEFSSTTFSWRVKKGRRRVTGSPVPSRARRPRRRRIPATSRASNRRPCSGTSTSGPRAHSPRHPTRRTATSVSPRWTTRSVSASTTPSEPSERQPAASHTLALARTAPSGITPCVPRAASVQALQALGSIRVVGHRSRTSCTTELGARLAVHLAVDHDDGSDAAGADAVRREDRDLTVARRLSGADAELVDDAVEELRGTVDVARRSHAHDARVRRPAA